MNIKRIASRIAILMAPDIRKLTIAEAIEQGVFEEEIQKEIEFIGEGLGIGIGENWPQQQIPPIKIKSVGSLGPDEGYIELEGGGMSGPWKLRFDADETLEEFIGGDFTDWYIADALPHPDDVNEFEKEDLDKDRFFKHR